jgi:hypothetical protein
MNFKGKNQKFRKLTIPVHSLSLSCITACFQEGLKNIPVSAALIYRTHAVEIGPQVDNSNILATSVTTKPKRQKRYNKTGNVHINATLKRVLLTTVTVEKQ